MIWRFVSRALGIGSIPYQEFYVLSWMLDILLLVFSLSRMPGQRRGSGMGFGAIIGFFGLVTLVWLGKKHGRKGATPTRVSVQAMTFQVIPVVLSRESLILLERRGIDARDLEQLSILINGMLGSLHGGEYGKESRKNGCGEDAPSAGPEKMRGGDPPAARKIGRADEKVVVQGGVQLGKVWSNLP